MKQEFYKYTEVFENTDKYNSIVDENPTINKKGKQINLRDMVNESYESSDLLTQLKRFGNVNNITKEQIFLDLDDAILKGDMRDIIEINKKAQESLKYLNAEQKRNIKEQEFAREYQKYVEDKKLKENKEIKEEVTENE